MEKEMFNYGKDAILIARVSTDAQVLTEGASPQIEDLREYATKLGYDPERFKVINSIESGFLVSDKKVGWNLVVDFIEANPTYHTIIASEMSRLSRVEEILHYIKNYLAEHKVQLIIKDIDFSLLNNYGEIGEGKGLIFALYASLANSEMRQKKERFQRALKDYRMRGYSIGGKELFGYDRICDGGLKDKKRYIINDEEAQLVYKIFCWYAYGINNDLSATSAATIALRCRAEGYDKHLHSKRNILKMLNDSAYIGHKTTQNKKRNPEYWNYKNADAPKYINCNSYECIYPRIIEDGLFAMVQERLAAESTHKETVKGISRDKSSKHVSVLAKIVKCKYCGNSFQPDYRVRNGKPNFTYRDGGARAKKGLRICEHSSTLSMRMLDSAVWSFVKDMVFDITSKQEQKRTTENKENLEAQIRNLEEGYTELDKKLRAISITFETKLVRTKDPQKEIDEYNDKVKQIDNEREQIDKAIEARRRHLLFLESAGSDNLKDVIESNFTIIENNKSEMSKYIHLLIKEIVPLCNMKNYNILRITALTNTDEAFDYSTNSHDGLPNIVAEKHDGIYFLIIQKDFKSHYRTRAVIDEMAMWDEERNAFFLSHNPDTIYTVEELMNFPIDASINRKALYEGLGIMELDFKLLDFYKDDMPSH